MSMDESLKEINGSTLAQVPETTTRSESRSSRRKLLRHFAGVSASLPFSRLPFAPLPFSLGNALPALAQLPAGSEADKPHGKT